MRNILVTALLLAGVLRVTPAASDGAQAERPVTFSHKAHIGQGLDCAACHDARAVPTPVVKPSACKDCHDPEAPRFVSGNWARRLKAGFPHRKHIENLACIDCHRGVANDSVVAPAPVMTVADCQKCHQDKDAGPSMARCAACHRGDMKHTAPDDHGRDWLARHGEESRFREPEHGRECAQCHSRGACASCHRERRPQSHSSLWRMRTHGQEAEWDRDRCRTCHESGSCIRCHKTTRPLTHQGTWSRTHGALAEDTANPRCAVCHGASFCQACHGG